MKVNFAFAYVLVKFTDDATEPITVDRACKLFTKVGCYMCWRGWSPSRRRTRVSCRPTYNTG